MIKVNGEKINVEYFPDGTQRILSFNSDIINTPSNNPTPYFEIIWLYESDKELFTLICIVEHIRNNNKYAKNSIINLVVPYFPNSRLDRVHSVEEVFTLKHFSKIINSLNFNKVGVLDAHSNVTLALVDNIVELKHVSINIITSLSNISNDYEKDIFNDIAIYFPDEGAYKRYKQYFEGSKERYCVYGKKVRDWSTGKILGLEIYNEEGEKITEKDIKNKVFLMIDDIISYGGTLAYGADKLKELGAKKIYAYASHTENSVLDQERGTLIKRLENGIIEKLYTTNSIYNGKHKNIELVYEY